MTMTFPRSLCPKPVEEGQPHSLSTSLPSCPLPAIRQGSADRGPWGRTSSLSSPAFPGQLAHPSALCLSWRPSDVFCSWPHPFSPAFLLHTLLTPAREVFLQEACLVTQNPHLVPSLCALGHLASSLSLVLCISLSLSSLHLAVFSMCNTNRVKSGISLS